MNLVITDHAIKRYRERGTNKPSRKTARESTVKNYIRKVFRHSVRIDDPSNCSISPWCQTVHLGDVLWFDEKTRIVLVTVDEGDSVICKTLFRAVCKQCGVHTCCHVRETPCAQS